MGEWPPDARYLGVKSLSQRCSIRLVYSAEAKTVNTRFCLAFFYAWIVLGCGARRALIITRNLADVC